MFNRIFSLKHTKKSKKFGKGGKTGDSQVGRESDTLVQITVIILTDASIGKINLEP